MNDKAAKPVDGKVYLIVPSTKGGETKTIVDTSVTDQGIKESVKEFFGWRGEVEADAATVEQQIASYVGIVKTVAEREEKKSSGLTLSEVTLSLTLSAKGNIGIASTSAEAGIKLVFKRG